MNGSKALEGHRQVGMGSFLSYCEELQLRSGSSGSGVYVCVCNWTKSMQCVRPALWASEQQLAGLHICWRSAHFISLKFRGKRGLPAAAEMRDLQK
eukprot:594359-Pelagomonas_calceolata.AAC.7